MTHQTQTQFQWKLLHTACISSSVETAGKISTEISTLICRFYCCDSMFGCVHCHKEWHLLNQLQTPNSSYNDNIFKHLCKTINPNNSGMVHFLFFMPSKKQDKILVLINCVFLGVPQTSELSSSCSQLSSWLLHRKTHFKTFQKCMSENDTVEYIEAHRDHGPRFFLNIQPICQTKILDTNLVSFYQC